MPRPTRKTMKPQPYMPAEVCLLWASDPARPGEVVLSQCSGSYTNGFAADSIGFREAQRRVAELQAEEVQARILADYDAAHAQCDAHACTGNREATVALELLQQARAERSAHQWIEWRDDSLIQIVRALYRRTSPVA